MKIRWEGGQIKNRSQLSVKFSVLFILFHRHHLHLLVYQLVLVVINQGTTLPETNGHSTCQVVVSPKGNEKIFQPSIFRGELLVLGRVHSGTLTW